MKIEEEFDLLKDYMKYFVELKCIKADYFLRKMDWERNNKEGPHPRLSFRSEKELEPLSFKDWIYIITTN